jgi:hypothetical protein
MRHFGIPPATAAEQLQKDHSEIVAAQRVEPLPAPTGAPPFRVASSALEIPAGAEGERVFHVIGDTGGVKDPNPQLAVASALATDLRSYPDVAFAYHVGDVVYFTGSEGEYPAQFYEPYAHYNRAIVGIPGNHDGEVEGSEPSLAGFVTNFCAVSPALPPAAAEDQRDTMTLPNCYWTLEDELVTIVGLYSNVPSGGVIEPDQEAWLREELRAASSEVPLIVALHHPPYSADAHHGGSKKMGALLDRTFTTAERWPELVLAGHVHNYQRFNRVTSSGKAIAYIVCGAGGYHNLHAMASDAVEGMDLGGGLTLASFCADDWGFLRLHVTASEIEGEYVAVDREGVVHGADSFRVPVSHA